jgi:hypothetical protein
MDVTGVCIDQLKKSVHVGPREACFLLSMRPYVEFLANSTGPSNQFFCPFSELTTAIDTALIRR